jgi:hypothetical protein
MSTDQVVELSERLALVRESVARIETRQSVILEVLERSQASLGEYHGRLREMENSAHSLRTKIWLISVCAGAACSVVWELVKRRFSGL